MTDIFNQRLAQALQEKGMTMYQIEKQGRVSKWTLQRVLFGGKLCHIDTARILAETLGVSLDWLCGFTEKKEVQR